MSAVGSREPWSGDAGARRLFALVRGACAGAEDFPTRLEAGLRAALTHLAADPVSARLLTVDTYPDDGEGALDALRAWIVRFGDLLQDAAAADPRASTTEPSFLAPFLIGGVRFQIARLAIADEISELLRLLPGILEALLAYYFEPGEPRELAAAALAAHQ